LFGIEALPTLLAEDSSMTWFHPHHDWTGFVVAVFLVVEVDVLVDVLVEVDVDVDVEVDVTLGCEQSC
jgi:hypothetical protein